MVLLAYQEYHPLKDWHVRGGQPAKKDLLRDKHPKTANIIAALRRKSEGRCMGKNPPKGPGRKGEVRQRTQFYNPVTELWQKRGPDGKIMDVKTTGGKFKGVRREK